jgi:hypothetical protein
MFPTEVVEKIKTRFVFNHFFSENRAVYDNVQQLSTAEQATDDNRRMGIA